jgi:hypothetical protein
VSIDTREALRRLAVAATSKKGSIEQDPRAFLAALTERDFARFWAKVNKSAECWAWSGAHNGRYGNVSVCNVRFSAHRFSYLAAKGGIPPGMIVRHACDNSMCVNPAHLVLGTDADNMADKMRRGRWRGGKTIGAAHPNTKLSPEKVRAIRDLWATGKYEQRQLAALFGVAHGTISSILYGRSWKHVA